MKRLEYLSKKEKKIIIGLMSGTSADGVDAVIVEVKNNSTKTVINEIAFQTYPYHKNLKNLLFKNSNALTARIDEVAKLDILLAMFFSDAVKNICRKANLPLNKIDLIGSHGHTIQHIPETREMFGKKVRTTMQIGNPSVVAKITGIPSIGDFRVGDIAVGGSGAPLVPLFDFLMFRSKKFNRALLNIGGIANITVLPKNCNIRNIMAFDTGPGNMVIDGLTKYFFNKQFDNNGKIAKSGNIISPLLNNLAKHPYLILKPPKSTGRELFGETFTRYVMNNFKNEKKEDIITTVTEFTALSVYINYLTHIRPKIKIDELFVSGGGVHNDYLMEALKRYFGDNNVNSVSNLNISPDAKEAICFAILANETISYHPGNVPNATGAKRQTILGTICLP